MKTISSKLLKTFEQAKLLKTFEQAKVFKFMIRSDKIFIYTV